MTPLQNTPKQHEIEHDIEIAIRRRAGSEGAGFLARWRHEIQISILRWRAAMMRAVLPKMSAKDLWLLAGVSANDGTEAERLEAIEEDFETCTGEIT